MKITELAKKLELMKTPLRSEMKWLEGIEQDGSFEYGLAVAGNIALLERVTKGGQISVDSVADNFTALCRTLPNAYGGIGYNRVSGFPALLEACSLGLGIDARIEKANVDNLAQKEISSSRNITRVFDRVVSPMSRKKRKSRQTNLMDLFRTPFRCHRQSQTSAIKRESRFSFQADTHLIIFDFVLLAHFFCTYIL